MTKRFGKAVVVQSLKRLVLLWSILFVNQVYAESTITPFVGVSVMQDDNLYRLDSAINMSLLPATLSKSDIVYQTNAGLGIEWRLSRQQLLLDASITDNRFENNSDLDYSGQDLQFEWNWLIGSDLSGQARFKQESTLSDFANTSNQQSSKKVNDSIYLLGKWRYLTEWELGASLSESSTHYDLVALQTSDRKGTATSLFWNYVAKSGSKTGLKLVQDRGLYPHRTVDQFSVVDNEYLQNILSMTADWRFSGKSRFTLDGGWVSRAHPVVTSRDYDGVSAKASFSWFLTSDTVMDLSLYRQIAPSDYGDTSFSENSGYALNASWQLSDKVLFKGLLKHEIKDYAAQEDSFKEDYDWLSLGLTYLPNRNIDLTLSYNQNARDSTQTLRDFESQTVALNLNIKL